MRKRTADSPPDEPQEKLSDKLRSLADELDRAEQGPPPADMNLKYAAIELAKHFKDGTLRIEVEWSDFGTAGYDIDYTMVRSYHTVETNKSLAGLVEKACIKAQPQDTLDKLDMMAKAE